MPAFLAFVSNRGGLPEVPGEAGLILNFPAEYHEKPYDRMFSEEQVAPVANRIMRFFDDRDFYGRYSVLAERQARKYSSDKVADNFIGIIKSIS